MVVPPSPVARRGLMWLLRVERGQHAGPEFLVGAEYRDLALRTDVVDALIRPLVAEQEPAPTAGAEAWRVVLHRPGVSRTHDEDLAWGAAARTALAARGLVGEFRVELSGGVQHRGG